FAIYQLGFFGTLADTLTQENPSGMVSFPAGIEPGGSYFVAFIMLNFFGALGAPYFVIRFFSIRSAKSLRSGFITVVTIVAVLEIVIVLLGLYARSEERRVGKSVICGICSGSGSK